MQTESSPLGWCGRRRGPAEARGLTARGRGTESIDLNPFGWRDRHHALFKKIAPPRTYPCVQTWRDPVDLDFEDGPHERRVSPVLDVGFCPVSRERD